MPNSRKPSSAAPEPADVFANYASLVQRLWPGTFALEFRSLDDSFVWCAGHSRDPQIQSLARAFLAAPGDSPLTRSFGDGTHALLVPILYENRRIGLLGIHARQPQSATWRLTPQNVENMLRPICELAARDINRRLGGPDRRGSDARARAVLSQRTEELEWLFAVTAELRSGSGELAPITALLQAATPRMESIYGAVLVPGRRIEATYGSDDPPNPDVALAFGMTKAHLLSFVQRRKAALAINSSSEKVKASLQFKILAAPVMIDEEVAGVLCFYRPMQSENFRNRQLHLGRHIARQIGAMLESEYDLATGLFNRSAFEQRATEAAAAAPPGQPHSVLFANVDRFSLINQEHGFPAGDEVIVRIADLLRAPNLPDDAIACRSAGASFAVFLPNHDLVAARARAEALQVAIARQFAGAAGAQGLLSLSIGVTRLAVSTDAVNRALAVAELAGRTARDRGGNRIEVILDVDENLMRRSADVVTVSMLREALAHDRITLYAQRIAPTFEPDSVGGMECLVRLIGRDGEIIAPGAFLPPAQRFGLMRSIDEVVLKKALRVVARYSGLLLNSGTYVSINVSGQSLSDDGFLDSIEGWVRESGAAPGLVTFEITETEAVANFERVAAMMRRLKRMGSRFALDDFGTGVNSLSYLKNLPVDRVKIDGSFVRDLLSSPHSVATVAAVLQLARSLEIECVAEFVESEQLLWKLRMMGVPFVQGNFIHQPEPLTDVLDSIARAQSARLRSLHY